MAIEFTDLHKDAIGEIMNISMGSAATAASELLNAKVWITTPKVQVILAENLHAEELQPAICVKIEYIKGISGSNLMFLKQDDVQLILAQLMSMPLEVSPDFEFDELNVSAVSEVMNQMMGSSATALSKVLDMSVDISTPIPYVMEEIKVADLQDYEPTDTIVSINFDFSIEGVIKSEFVSVMSVELAAKLADMLLTKNEEDAAVEQQPQQPEAQVASPTPQPQQAQQPYAQQPMPAPAYDPNMANMSAQMPQYAPPPYGYPPGQGMMPPPYAQPYGYGYPPQINIQNAQLHQFENFDVNLPADQQENLKLLMGVPLQISVEIGTAKKRVKEILEFSQGTIIELERQAGAPVDIVINGNLIARGDVVVIDDNFAVRITEIIKSKFMDSLGKE